MNRVQLLRQVDASDFTLRTFSRYASLIVRRFATYARQRERSRACHRVLQRQSLSHKKTAPSKVIGSS